MPGPREPRGALTIREERGISSIKFPKLLKRGIYGTNAKLTGPTVNNVAISMVKEMIEYINLSDSDIIKPIYRIISFDRLIKLFNSNSLTLVKPGKWDDPFENIISKTKIYTENSFVEVGLRDNVHGICWSKRSVSDAMWRIYSSDKKAVRIKSTPEIISRNVDSWLKSHSNSKCFIGKVDYITTKDIRQKAKDFTKRVMAGKTERSIAESLLFKRNSFSHEEEIRVILIDNDGASTNGLLMWKSS
jgi:hypothetical protein